MSHIPHLYDESLKVLWDNYSIIETAKEEGREEGKEESRIEIAREMKKEGLPVAQIARFTGLGTDDIEKL